MNCKTYSNRRETLDDTPVIVTYKLFIIFITAAHNWLGIFLAATGMLLEAYFFYFEGKLHKVRNNKLLDGTLCIICTFLAIFSYTFGLIVFTNGNPEMAGLLLLTVPLCFILANNFGSSFFGLEVHSSLRDRKKVRCIAYLASFLLNAGGIWWETTLKLHE